MESVQYKLIIIIIIKIMSSFSCSKIISQILRGFKTQLSHLFIFYSIQQAILTFEDDQLDRALENLKRAQRVCYVENVARKGTAHLVGRDEQLMRQILYADCELYMALLTFLKQG